jgi:hypothetical protein
MLFGEGTLMGVFERPIETELMFPNFGIMLNDSRDPTPDNGALVGVFETVAGIAIYPEYTGRTALEAERLMRNRLSATVLTPEPATVLLVAPLLIGVIPAAARRRLLRR